MAKRSRKKKTERSDFAKVRLKVGRRLPRCLNETRVSLSTGKILVRDQQLQAAPAAAADVDEESLAAAPPRQHVRKLRSSQLDERIAAANRLARWLAAAGTQESAGQLLAHNEVAEFLAPCLRDSSSGELRAAARRVFCGLLDRGLGELPVYRPVLFQALRACWSHLDEAVQRESVELLASLLERAPAVALDNARQIRRLFCRLRRRLTTTGGDGGGGGGAGGGADRCRSRGHLLALAECVGRFAGLLAAELDKDKDLDDKDLDDDDESGDDGGGVECRECLGDFDLNEAAWGRHLLSWRGDMPTAAVEDDDGGEGVDDPSTTDADVQATAEFEEFEEFECSFAGLVKELLPADFAGCVAGPAAFAEVTQLLRCLRSLLALHFASGRLRRLPGDCDCGRVQQQQQQRVGTAGPIPTCCSLAVGDLLGTSLCPLFPLTVLSLQPSSGGSISKKRRRPGGKGTLKDVAGKAKELNSLLVDCALLCAPRLAATLDKDCGGEEVFVLSVYKFLADQYAPRGDAQASRIPAADAKFWLAASRRLIFQHPDSRLARLFLAFFADSLRRGRFDRPLPVTRFLTRVACRHGCDRRGLSNAATVEGQLNFLPARLVEQFDSARLHLLLPPSAAAAAGAEAAADVAWRRQTAAASVRCLLQLMARRFPGAEAAAAGASDRLVRYCPDRMLRRSLSAALAVA